MTRRALLAVAALLLTPAASSALCAWDGPVCSSFWYYDAVFDGTVVGIEQAPPDPNEPTLYATPYRVVTFYVHESWRGEAASQVQLRMPGGLGKDGLMHWAGDSFEFAHGKRYLVFAHRAGKNVKYLTTSTCEPTAAVPSKSAADSLSFLKTLSQPATGSRVSGGIFDDATRDAGRRFDPSVIARVTLEGDGYRQSVTSPGGVYSFEGIQPGNYVLTVFAPGYTGQLTYRVSIPDPRACAKRDFYLRR